MDEFEERIRQRAYEIWVEEGRPVGRAEDHWRRAHAETRPLSDLSREDLPTQPAAAAREPIQPNAPIDSLENRGADPVEGFATRKLGQKG